MSAVTRWGVGIVGLITCLGAVVPATAGAAAAPAVHAPGRPLDVHRSADGAAAGGGTRVAPGRRTAPGPYDVAGASTVDGLRAEAAGSSPARAAEEYVRSAGLARTGDVGPAHTSTTGELTTVRLAQRYGGLPVVGGTLVVRLRGSGAGRVVTGITDQFFRGLHVPATPTIGAATAAAVARRAAEADAATGNGRILRSRVIGPAPASGRDADTPRDRASVRDHGLVVLPFGRGHLAYHVTVSGHVAWTDSAYRREVYVDATSARVLWSYGSLETADVVSPEKLLDGSPVSVRASRDRRGVSTLVDDTRRGWLPGGAGPRIVTSALVGRPEDGRTAVIRTRTLPFGPRVTRLGAIDAHVAAGRTFDYLHAVLGRNGVDGRGGSVGVVVGAPMNNASYAEGTVTFGLGDGTRWKPFSADVDVVAHEIVHAVTEREAGLFYFGQSGQMNEAYSDYFGNAVDLRVSRLTMASPGAGLIGEDLCAPTPTPSCPMRNLDDGRTTVRDYDGTLNDNLGVHLNSTIYSGAMWDVRRALDPDLADRIMYRALTGYLTPFATLVDGRKATLAAAADLGAGTRARDAIVAAFDRHGIADGWERRRTSDAVVLAAGLSPLTAADGVRVRDGRYVVQDDPGDTGNAIRLVTGRTDGTGRRHVIRAARGVRLMGIVGLDRSHVVYVLRHDDGVEDVMSYDDGTGLTRRLFATSRYLGSVAVSAGRVLWTVWDGRRPESGAEVWVRGLSGGRASRIGHGEVRGVALTPTHAAWMTQTPRGALLTVRRLTTGWERRRYVAAWDENVLVDGPVLTAHRVMWTVYDTRHRDGDLPRTTVHGAPLDLGADRVLLDRDLSATPTPGIMAWDASDTAITYLDPQQGPTNHPTLWQRDLDGGPAVRVTCNPSGAVLFAADEGRRVVWIDASRGRVDVVTRATPAAACP